MTSINATEIKKHLTTEHCKALERGDAWSYEGEALKLIEEMERKFTPLHPVYHVIELGCASALPVERSGDFKYSRRKLSKNKSEELLDLMVAVGPYAQTEVFDGSIDVGFDMMTHGPCVTFQFFSGERRTLSPYSDESAFLDVQDILIGHGCETFQE